MTKAKILSIGTVIAYLIGMIYIYAFRGSEYGWMLEMTPDIGKAPDSTDDWLLLSKCALAFTLATQIPMLLTMNRKYHAVLILVAVVFYWICNNH